MPACRFDFTSCRIGAAGTAAHWPAAAETDAMQSCRRCCGGSAAQPQRPPRFRLLMAFHAQSYRRLFPPAYVESLAPAKEAHHLKASSIWGQVLNHHHELKPGVADLVLHRLQPSTATTPWRAFTLQPLVAHCSVEHFFS